MGLGLAQGALDEALEYAKERMAFGQPISKFQAIQAKLADMSTEIEAARLLTYKAALEKDAGKNFGLTAAQAKLKTGRLAVQRLRGGRPDPRRLRLHRGVPRLPLLPRRQDPHHRRGHRRGPADGHRAGARLLAGGRVERLALRREHQPARDLPVAHDPDEPDRRLDRDSAALAAPGLA